MYSDVNSALVSVAYAFPYVMETHLPILPVFYGLTPSPRRITPAPLVYDGTKYKTYISRIYCVISRCMYMKSIHSQLYMGVYIISIVVQLCVGELPK